MCKRSFTKAAKLPLFRPKIHDHLVSPMTNNFIPKKIRIKATQNPIVLEGGIIKLRGVSPLIGMAMAILPLSD